MRRKSERNAGKKVKSPEKKLEKVKRTRTSRRRKQSSSSENDSNDERSPVVESDTVLVEAEAKAPETPAKEGSPEDSQDQVWQVKTSEPSDMGEIQKLKICLTRPPSTPERSPCSKRKHSRATSSSDTASVETGDEKKKSKHKSRRSARESKDDTDKSTENLDEECVEAKSQELQDEVSKHSDRVASKETPMSTTDEGSKEHTQKCQKDLDATTSPNEALPKLLDADTTCVSPKTSPKPSVVEDADNKDCDLKISEQTEKESIEMKTEGDSQSTQESISNVIQSQDHSDGEREVQDNVKVSKIVREESVTVSEKLGSADTVGNKPNNKNDVVESSSIVESDSAIPDQKTTASNERLRTISNDSTTDKEDDSYKRKSPDHLDSNQSTTQETVPNGQAPPIVVNRKRRWGSRPSKVSTQKSITISTDVLNEIIPDVKPTEFHEVIEEKKHKRVESHDKLDRPILPKIIIDNSENVELLKKEKEKEYEAREKENVRDKTKESNMSMNRKISIVKDSDSVIARPPSPPRNKQSAILYITNLVRPFTLLQLKNLLLRTGRIAEDGFWIDKIKSKCFVEYESEDQAVETRHALHGVTWPVSNPKTLQVDFSTKEAFQKAKLSEESEIAPASAIPGTVEDWLREQDKKRERGEIEKPWERKAAMREWDLGKNEKEKDKIRRDEHPLEKRRNRSIERSPEPSRKIKKKEEEAPSKLLDDLFRKTKTTPCIYWLPLSTETIAIKEEQRRAHMAEHERRMQEMRRNHRDRRH